MVGAASVEVLRGLSIRQSSGSEREAGNGGSGTVSKQVIVMRHDLKMRRGKQIAPRGARIDGIPVLETEGDRFIVDD